MILELIENSQDVELKFTETAGGYWDNSSINNDLDAQLWKQLVPMSGEADTIHGELLRAASRFYRDMYQNGGCNLVEFEDDGHSCDHCDYYENRDDEDEDYDSEHSDNCPESWVLDDYYQEMYDFLEKHLNMEARKTLEEVKAEILKQPFDIPIIFDKLVDQVIHLIQITKNQPIERLEAE